MIRAFIFDCFGVLTTDGWLPFKEQHFGHDQELEQEATNLNKMTDAGLLSYSDFVNKISKLSGKDEQHVRSNIESNVANQELFDFISTLKPKYKIGMLSNAGSNWLDKLFTPEQLSLFDEQGLSYQTGHLKPSADAYHHIASSLNVEPSECVFIDDIESYCEAARDVGMKAVWYQNFAQTKSDIEKILANSKN